jgi:hypothetical protein
MEKLTIPSKKPPPHFGESRGLHFSGKIEDLSICSLAFHPAAAEPKFNSNKLLKKIICYLKELISKVMDQAKYF